MVTPSAARDATSVDSPSGLRPPVAKKPVTALSPGHKRKASQDAHGDEKRDCFGEPAPSHLARLPSSGLTTRPPTTSSSPAAPSTSSPAGPSHAPLRHTAPPLSPAPASEPTPARALAPAVAPSPAASVASRPSATSDTKTALKLAMSAESLKATIGGRKAAVHMDAFEAAGGWRGWGPVAAGQGEQIRRSSDWSDEEWSDEDDSEDSEEDDEPVCASLKMVSEGVAGRAVVGAEDSEDELEASDAGTTKTPEDKSEAAVGAEDDGSQSEGTRSGGDKDDGETKC